MRQISIVVAVVLASASPTEAQFFSLCETGSTDELIENISSHQEHVLRMTTKFLHGYYHQGHIRVLAEEAFISLPTVQAFLQRMAPTRSAVLFHAFTKSKLCAWLILPDGSTLSSVTTISDGELTARTEDLRKALGVEAAVLERSPRKRGVKLVRPDSTRPAPDSAFAALSSLLLPEPISDWILLDQPDMLIVVPVGPIGTLPLAALNVGARTLADVTPVVVAPGFHAFNGYAVRTPHTLSDPIIVGNPTGRTVGDWVFPDLPGARSEAIAVASMLGAEPVLGDEATVERVVSAVQKSPMTGLIYLATHGLSDPANPLDNSVLVLSDGLWRARDIQNLPLNGNPIVVLSACQTGLGKDFDVGTIGMARAFMRAGASSVVMSLWNVDDRATAELMARFIDIVRSTSMPLEQALREAMLATREDFPNPAHWAGFSVFGFARSANERFDESTGRWLPMRR